MKEYNNCSTYNICIGENNGVPQGPPVIHCAYIYYINLIAIISYILSLLTYPLWLSITPSLACRMLPLTFTDTHTHRWLASFGEVITLGWNHHPRPIRYFIYLGWNHHPGHFPYGVNSSPSTFFIFTQSSYASGEVITLVNIFHAKNVHNGRSHHPLQFWYNQQTHQVKSSPSSISIYIGILPYSWIYCYRKLTV